MCWGYSSRWGNGGIGKYVCAKVGCDYPSLERIRKQFCQESRSGPGGYITKLCKPEGRAEGRGKGVVPITTSLWERRARKPSAGKGNWVPQHEACSPPSRPVARSFSSEPCRDPEPLSRRRSSEKALAGIQDGAGATRRGTGEVKGGESRRRRERGERGGVTERGSLLSEPSERSASGQQSREAKPTAAAVRRAKRERS